jgi:hypothetical protein
MIKNTIKNFLFAGSLIGASLGAQDIAYNTDTFSLVGIEGGLSSLDYEGGTRLNNTQNSTSLANVGLKLGAESKDYRIFISGRYFYDPSKDYDYIVTYGGELQYKFNLSQEINFFIGVNAGYASMKFRASNETFSRIYNDPYVGGDLGTNISIGKSVDLEFGARVMSIQANNTINKVTYRVNNIISGYASIIFKWKMD